MAKQAKKQDKAASKTKKQRRHNRKTKGVNTNKRPSLWAIRRYVDANEEVREQRVYVPARTLWDPWDNNKNDENKAFEPFDALHLNWREEMMHFAVEANARIGKVDLGDGLYLYRVFKGENVNKPDETFLEVQSRKKFIVETRGKRRRRRAQKVG